MIKRPLLGVFLMLAAGLVTGLVRGALYAEKYGEVQQALWQAQITETPVYAAGLIEKINLTETSVSYQLSHCTLEMQGTSESIPDLIIYQSFYSNSNYYSGSNAATEDKTASDFGNTGESVAPEFHVGDYIAIHGVPASFSEATNDGGYDEAKVSFSKGIVGKFQNPEMRTLNPPTRLRLWGSVLGKLNQLRNGFSEVYQETVDVENLGILEAMCLGEKEHLSKTLSNQFQNAGISHMLAISGVHISVFGMFLFRRFRKGRLPVGLVIGISVCLSFLFAVATGSGTSALRAVVMFGVLLGSIPAGRSYDGLCAMALAGILLLVAEPYCLTGASFQFSFAAITGIFGVQELIRVKYKSLHPMFSALLVSMAAWLTTLPLMAWYQYRITTYSVLLNLLVLPLAAPILVTGLLGGAIRLLPLTGLWKEPCLFLGKGFLKIAECCIWFLRTLVKGYGKLPGGSILVGKPGLWVCLMFYLFILIIYFIIKKKKNFLYISMIIPFISLFVLYHHEYRNQVVFLDVGQGDGIYLECEDGTNYMIDGGSSNKSNLGQYTLLPFLEYHARDSIEVWFVSHCDTDHVSGLLELLEEDFAVGRIVFVDDVVQNENYDSIIELAARREIPVAYMGEGDFLQTESIKLVSLRGGTGGEAEVGRAEGSGGTSEPDSTVQVGGTGKSEEDCNEHGLVLLAKYIQNGHTFLFAGDSSIQVENDFLSNLQQQLEGKSLFLMKADHHGSKYSNSEELLQEAKPKFSVVSCSLTNRYGHPHDETLQRLAEVGCEVFRTDQMGEICILFDKNGADYCVRGIGETK